MYLLIEGDDPTTYKMVNYDLCSVLTRKMGENEWELIGIVADLPAGEDEIRIALFETADDAYKALRELFDAITSEIEFWDVVEYKKKIEMPF